MHKLSKSILLYGLCLAIILGAGGHFLQPTIGNVFIEIDPCGPYLCLSDDCSDCFNPYSSGEGNAGETPCNRDKCTAWKDGLPEGKLVVIIPKIVTIGIDTYSIGFSYPPANYSKDEISQITQHYLQRLNLREEEVHLVEFDVLMDTWGEPRIYVPDYKYFSGGSSHILAHGLTEWKILFRSDENVVGGLHVFRVVFHYSKQPNSCGDFCAELGELYPEPSENVKVQIKIPISARIHNIGTKIDKFWSDYWSRMTRKYWFFEPIFYYLLLVLVVFVFETVWKVRNKKTLE